MELAQRMELDLSPDRNMWAHLPHPYLNLEIVLGFCLCVVVADILWLPVQNLLCFLGLLTRSTTGSYVVGIFARTGVGASISRRGKCEPNLNKQRKTKVASYKQTKTKVATNKVRTKGENDDRSDNLSSWEVYVTLKLLWE
jgi:hypothetical protein